MALLAFQAPGNLFRLQAARTSLDFHLTMPAAGEDGVDVALAFASRVNPHHCVDAHAGAAFTAAAMLAAVKNQDGSGHALDGVGSFREQTLMVLVAAGHF